jgi:hypothetical protein
LTQLAQDKPSAGRTADDDEKDDADEAEGWFDMRAMT